MWNLPTSEDFIVTLGVKSVYLNAPLECELYMEQAKDFEIENKNSNERLVYKLKKSLYGLKQSGRNWNNLLHTYLIEQNVFQSLSDVCVSRKYKDEYMIIIVCVDDILTATKCNQIIQCHIQDIRW